MILTGMRFVIRLFGWWAIYLLVGVLVLWFGTKVAFDASMFTLIEFDNFLERKNLLYVAIVGFIALLTVVLSGPVLGAPPKGADRFSGLGNTTFTAVRFFGWWGLSTAVGLVIMAVGTWIAFDFPMFDSIDVEDFIRANGALYLLATAVISGVLVWLSEI